MYIVDFFIWIAIFSITIAISSWLWETLGVAIASQGLIMNTAALIFVISQQAHFNYFFSLSLALLTGTVLSLIHLIILKFTSKDILLIVSVLLNFLWNELWLSLPKWTGGSGGILLDINLLMAVLSISVAALATIVFFKTILPRTNFIFFRTVARELGFFCGMLGVSTLHLFFFGFIFVGLILSLLGVSGVQSSGVLTQNLFSTSWSLSVLTIVIAPNISNFNRILILPILFILIRHYLRQVIPPAIATSQIIEFIFPATVLLWSHFKTVKRELSYDSF